MDAGAIIHWERKQWRKLGLNYDAQSQAMSSGYFCSPRAPNRPFDSTTVPSLTTLDTSTEHWLIIIRVMLWRTLLAKLVDAH